MPSRDMNIGALGLPMTHPGANYYISTKRWRGIVELQAFTVDNGVADSAVI